eukprot:8055605-Pyramimonas_sp.AAC.1
MQGEYQQSGPMGNADPQVAPQCTFAIPEGRRRSWATTWPTRSRARPSRRGTSRAATPTGRARSRGPSWTTTA